MTRLLISSGNVHAECRLAVGHILRRMAAEGPLDVVGAKAERHGPVSAIVTLPEGRAAMWRGTTLWRCQSPLRPQHKRKNWFVGVFGLAELALPETCLRPEDLRFERFRAGGACAEWPEGGGAGWALAAPQQGFGAGVPEPVAPEFGARAAEACVFWR